MQVTIIHEFLPHDNNGTWPIYRTTMIAHLAPDEQQQWNRYGEASLVDELTGLQIPGSSESATDRVHALFSGGYAFQHRNVLNVLRIEQEILAALWALPIYWEQAEAYVKQQQTTTDIDD